MARRRTRNSNRNAITERDIVKEFVGDVHEAIDYEEVETAVCFIKHKSGEISAITTYGSAVEVVGLIEVGKNLIYEDRFTEDE